MNLLTARKILELPDDYNEIILKKNYKSLAMKYHPDKNKETDANEKFSEINTAYEFLLKKPEDVNFNVFNNIFKSFNAFNAFNFPIPQNKPIRKKEVSIHLTPKEYFDGTVKMVIIKERCNCEKFLCKNCAGSGFSLVPSNIITFKPLSMCMDCLGEGYIQNCLNCENGIIDKNINITIAPNINSFEIFHPMVGLIKLSIPEPYFFKEKMFFRFNIYLKESLTGFNKIFKDPFGESHNIVVTGIIKSNDGYQLKIKNSFLILVFNVIYPEKINEAVIEQLKSLNF